MDCSCDNFNHLFANRRTLGVPKLVGKLIDVGIVSGDQQVIKTIGIQMFLVAFIGTIAAIISSYLSALVVAKFGFQVRGLFFKNFNNSR